MTDPIERPWNDWKNPIRYWRPVAYRASFSAASTASVPELVRKLRAGLANGAIASSRSQTSRVDRQVEVRGRVVQQLGRLLLDRLDDPRVAVPRGRHRDPRVEVEEDVAVHVLDDRAGAPARDERIGPRERRRCDLAIPLDPRHRLRARDLGRLRVTAASRRVRLPHARSSRRSSVVRHSSITVRHCSRMYCWT